MTTRGTYATGLTVGPAGFVEHRFGPKQLQVDLNELEAMLTPIPAGGGHDAP